MARFSSVPSCFFLFFLGLNCCLYYDNKDMARTISLVPTSAITGEGIPDLLGLLMRLTQSKMSKRLTYISELQVSLGVEHFVFVFVLRMPAVE